MSKIEEKAVADGSQALRPLRKLINDRRSHRYYKCVHEIEIGADNDGSNSLWEKSERKIEEEILDAGYKYELGDEIGGGGRRLDSLEPKDIIVEKRKLHYGRKEDNPVSQCRFCPKKDMQDLTKPIDELPTAVEVATPPSITPITFMRKTIRFICRSPEKCEFLAHAVER